MNRTRYILGLSFLSACLAFDASAWGRRGHEITAGLAERHLTDVAAGQVDEILEGETLVDVATFADDVRSERPETREWHFADIPITVTSYSASRDCRNGDCVVEAIERSKRTLADRTKPRADRAEALKFLVHFIGDMHQPLHSADNNDRGGNDVTLRFLGSRANLHQVWDSRLIDRSRITSDDAYIDHLEEFIEEGDDEHITRGSTEDWVNEAHAVAVNHAYRFPSSRTVGNAYVRRNLLVVDMQLLRGGLRLARVLNEALR